MKLLSLVYSPSLKRLQDLVIRFTCTGNLHCSATRSVPKAALTNAAIITYKIHGRVLFQSNHTWESTYVICFGEHLPELEPTVPVPPHEGAEGSYRGKPCSPTSIQAT